MQATCYINNLGEVVEWVQMPSTTGGAVKVIASAEREFYLDELRRDAKIGQNTLLQSIINMLPTLVLAGVVIIALFTVPDIYKEHNVVVDKLGQVAGQLGESMESMRGLQNEAISVIEERQILEGKDVATGQEVPN